MNKAMLLLSLFTFCLLPCFQSVALDSENDAPALKLSKWLMNGPVKIEFDKKDKDADKKTNRPHMR